jgi:hypothetical protein
MKFRTAQQTLKSERKSPEGVWTDQQTRATESKSLHEGPDTNILTADAGSILCNHPNGKVASPNALQSLLEVLVVDPDARSQVRTPPKQI